MEQQGTPGLHPRLAQNKMTRKEGRKGTPHPTRVLPPSLTLFPSVDLLTRPLVSLPALAPTTTISFIQLPESRPEVSQGPRTQPSQWLRAEQC